MLAGDGEHRPYLQFLCNGHVHSAPRDRTKKPHLAVRFDWNLLPADFAMGNDAGVDELRCLAG